MDEKRKIGKKEKTLQVLPDTILEKSIGFNQSKDNVTRDSHIEYLKKRLPNSDLADIDSIVKKNFPISKELTVQKKIKLKRCIRQAHLTGSRKRELGLYSISKKGIKFNDVLPIHNCWVGYMEQYLDLHHLESKSGSLKDEEISLQLLKADYHGSYIRVTKSKSPSLVGIEGIVVFETKNVFTIVGKDDITRVVPKASCEFKIRLGSFEISFLGRNLLVRPAERSKRAKPVMYFDL